MGAPKNVLIEDTDFYGAHNAGVMMYTYGGWNISISGSRAMNRRPDKPAVGRWFTCTALGNRFDNFYLGNNETKNLMPSEDYHDQNQGEQVMWEGLGIAGQQKPVKVNGNKYTLKRGMSGSGKKGIRALDMFVFEHNKIVDTPFAFRYTSSKNAPSMYGHLGFYENVLKLGAATEKGSVGVHLLTEKRLFRKNNTVKGFENNWKFEPAD